MSDLRPLTKGEIRLARSVFGDTIDYSKVRIANRRAVPLQPKHGGMCTANTINISGRAYESDYACNSYHSMKGFFIHEMTHIWQYQKNPLYIGSKFVKEFARHRFNYMAKAYSYDLDRHDSFDKYGLEQQACMVQDYFALRFNKGMGRSNNCLTSITDAELFKRLHLLLAPHFPPLAQAPLRQPQPNAPKPPRP